MEALTDSECSVLTKQTVCPLSPSYKRKDILHVAEITLFKKDQGTAAFGYQLAKNANTHLNNISIISLMHCNTEMGIFLQKIEKSQSSPL